MKRIAKFAIVSSSLALAAHGEPALTIYNQQFAVVRELVPVELKAGVNEIAFNGMTAFAEPQSVIFRDPAGAAEFTLLTQSYRNDAVSQESLLNLFEGKTIKFLVNHETKSSWLKARSFAVLMRCSWQRSEKTITINADFPV